MPSSTPAEPMVEEDRVCPECGSEHLVRDYARGELVCDSCGRVISESAIVEGAAALMGLPRPGKDEAGFICKKALEKGLVRGRSIEAIVAAAVYAACRIDGVPRTLDELQQVTGVRKKTIGKAYGACLRTLTLRVPPSRPTDYVSRFCSRLGLSNAVDAEAHKILKELEKIDSSMSLSPSGTA